MMECVVLDVAFRSGGFIAEFSEHTRLDEACLKLCDDGYMTKVEKGFQLTELGVNHFAVLHVMTE